MQALGDAKLYVYGLKTHEIGRSCLNNQPAIQAREAVTPKCTLNACVPTRSEWGPFATVLRNHSLGCCKSIAARAQDTRVRAAPAFCAPFLAPVPPADLAAEGVALQQLQDLHLLCLLRKALRRLALRVHRTGIRSELQELARYFQLSGGRCHVQRRAAALGLYVQVRPLRSQCRQHAGMARPRCQVHAGRALCVAQVRHLLPAEAPRATGHAARVGEEEEERTDLPPLASHVQWQPALNRSSWLPGVRAPLDQLFEDLDFALVGR
eukprot:CAMPEP_0179093234 /NCGR_PEP_ID=MMETSP0796-20121207/42686_1 /TAXON_ID=73915 /ORGANISM="Pyrodinium bahamense, Strain pbaha01" /LENGTH=265 /DNA_ID=CAMNT_0020790861 /DNA_START=270 /DNA_END=1065 /DNA_ORIENTATION=+